MGGRVGSAEYILDGLDDDERLRIIYYDAAALRTSMRICASL